MQLHAVYSLPKLIKLGKTMDAIDGMDQLFSLVRISMLSM